MPEPIQLVPICKADTRAPKPPIIIDFRWKAASPPPAPPPNSGPPAQLPSSEIIDVCGDIIEAAMAVATVAADAEDGDKVALGALTEAMEKLNALYARLRGAATDRALGTKPGSRASIDPRELTGQPRKPAGPPPATMTARQIDAEVVKVVASADRALVQIRAAGVRLAKEQGAKARTAPTTKSAAPAPSKHWPLDIAAEVKRDAANAPPPPKPLTPKEIAKRKLEAIPMDAHGFPPDLGEYVRLREIAKDDPKPCAKGEWPDDIAEDARLRDAEERAEERRTGMARSRNPFLLP